MSESSTAPPPLAAAASSPASAVSSRAVPSGRGEPTDVAILAHDVCSPLQTIATCCDLLAERQAESDTGSPMLLELIRAAVAQIRAVVDNVMDPAFGEAAESSSPAWLPDALEEAVARHRAEGAIRGVKVEHVHDVHVGVEMENSRLQRVLANLLTNAIRHTPPGGAVRLSARPAGDRVWVFVADTGVGIPPELVPRLFDPATPPIRPGGVGLRIVKRIVDEAGGSITVASAVGSGTTFTLILPRRDLIRRVRVRGAHVPAPAWLTARTPGRKEDPCRTP